jgi:hypothetical protein
MAEWTDYGPAESTINLIMLIARTVMAESELVDILVQGGSRRRRCQQRNV